MFFFYTCDIPGVTSTNAYRAPEKKYSRLSLPGLFRVQSIMSNPTSVNAGQPADIALGPSTMLTSPMPFK